MNPPYPENTTTKNWKGNHKKILVVKCFVAKLTKGKKEFSREVLSFTLYSLTFFCHHDIKGRCLLYDRAKMLVAK